MRIVVTGAFTKFLISASNAADLNSKVAWNTASGPV